MQHTPWPMGQSGRWRRAGEAFKDYLSSLLGDDVILKRILLIFIAVQVAGALWDLPGDHGWENDGIAPRGVFSGLSGNLKPGNAHRYPLFHYVLSVIASVPALLLTPFVAGGFDKAALLGAGAGTVVMTGVSICVKLLNIALSALGVAALSAFARRTVDVQAARFCALFCVLNLSFSYYARASNLDGPYLAWAAFLLERLSLGTQGTSEEQARRYLQMGVLGAASVATKDQAYALVFPLFLVACLQALSLRSLLHIVRLGASSAVAYAFFSGALFNPSGFLARVAMLRGPNSQDWKVYEDGALGLRQNMIDLARNVPEWWWPWPVLIVVAIGLLVCLVWALRDRNFAPLEPLVMGLGSLFLFTLVVRRDEHRFILPLAFVASYYAGVGASALLHAAKDRGAQVSLRVGLLILASAAGVRCAALLLTQWSDGRREVAHFLAELPRGSRVETYGLPVYLPHFWLGPDSPYKVSRLQPVSGDAWAPIRGVESVRDAYENLGQRKPDVLLLPEGFLVRYLARSLGPGERISEQERKAQADQDAVQFMQRAIKGELPGYELAFVAEAKLPGMLSALNYAPVRIHGSTGTRTWVFVRKARS